MGRSEVGDWEVEGYVDEETDDIFCCCCGTLGRLLVVVCYLERREMLHIPFWQGVP